MEFFKQTYNILNTRVVLQKGLTFIVVVWDYKDWNFNTYNQCEISKFI